MGDADPMTGKASFDDVYNQADPRGYVRTLSQLDYQIPHHAQPLFSHLAGLLRERYGEPLAVVDLCSSYGINPALLNHDLTLQQLYDHYLDPQVAGVDSDELALIDKDFYGHHRRPDAVRTVGLDVAPNAVAYAERVGIIDVGGDEDLEEGPPSPSLRGALADAGLVTVTGGIGYITEATFDRILATVDADRPPWVAAFVLRWVDMQPIAQTLARHGLVLQRLEGRTFRQRRFADAGEREHALEELRRLGVDPDGVETDGFHHTWLYVARPRDEAAATPLARVLAPVR